MIFAVANVEELHGRPLLVLNTYEGQAVKAMKDEIIRPYESDDQVIAILRELHVDEVWTADFNLAASLLAEPGLRVELKHRLDVAETRRAVNRHAETLMYALGIEEQPQPPELAAWRTYLITKLEATIKWLRR